MKTLIEKLMAGAKQYSVIDFGVLKLTLLSIGILLGVYFSEFFALWLREVWAVAVVCFVYIIWSTLTKAFCQKK